MAKAQILTKKRVPDFEVVSFYQDSFLRNLLQESSHLVSTFSEAVVSKLVNTKDQFCGRQLIHRPELGGRF